MGIAPQHPQSLPAASTDLSERKGGLPVAAPPGSLGAPLPLSASTSSSPHPYWNLYWLLIKCCSHMTLLTTR